MPGLFLVKSRRDLSVLHWVPESQQGRVYKTDASGENQTLTFLPAIDLSTGQPIAPGIRADAFFNNVQFRWTPATNFTAAGTLAVEFALAGVYYYEFWTGGGGVYGAGQTTFNGSYSTANGTPAAALTTGGVRYYMGTSAAPTDSGFSVYYTTNPAQAEVAQP